MRRLSGPHHPPRSPHPVLPTHPALTLSSSSNEVSRERAAEAFDELCSAGNDTKLLGGGSSVLVASALVRCLETSRPTAVWHAARAFKSLLASPGTTGLARMPECAAALVAALGRWRADAACASELLCAIRICALSRKATRALVAGGLLPILLELLDDEIELELRGLAIAVVTNLLAHRGEVVVCGGGGDAPTDGPLHAYIATR